MAIDPLTAGVITTGFVNGAAAIGNGLIGLINNEYNKKQNEWNKQFAREQFEYNKYANENAAQIRAKDLEAAGLSKTLAAGDSASTVGYMSNPAQSQEFSKLDKEIIGNQIAGQLAQIKSVNADSSYKEERKNTEKSLQNMYDEQANLFKEEALSQKDYRDNLVSQTALNNAREKYHLTENEFLKWDYALSVLENMRSNDQKHSIYNAVKSFSFEVNNRLTEFLKGLDVPKLGDFLEFLKSLGSSSATQ